MFRHHRRFPRGQRHRRAQEAARDSAGQESVQPRPRCLRVTNRGLPGECGLGVWDAPGPGKTSGRGRENGFLSRCSPTRWSGSWPSKPATESAEQAADDLLRKADKSYIDRKYVVRSFQFYQTVQNLMRKYGCNAFTIDCFDFCASRLPEKWTITPCLIHTLMKDRQIASACESDLSALLAMRMLMSVSNKSSHMGNCDRSHADQGRLPHQPQRARAEDERLRPARSAVSNWARFTNSGWGTKAIVDFMNNREKTVTVARVNPSATKVLVLRGTLVGADGLERGHHRLLGPRRHSAAGGEVRRVRPKAGRLRRPHAMGLSATTPARCSSLPKCSSWKRM